MELIFVGVGSFLFGAFFYVMWRGNFKKIYISFFKTKEIQKCKERLRTLDFSRIESKKRVDVYVSKLQDFSPEIIAEAEKLYFKQKLFDDLTEYLLQMTYDINEVFITKKIFKRFEYSKKLNKEHKLVKTLIEHNWNPKIIKSAFQKIERGLKNNGKPRTQPSFPKLKEQVEQDLEETTSSTSSGTNRDSARGISRASSNESGASPSIPGELTQRGNVQIGTIAPKGESTHRDKKYFN